MKPLIAIKPKNENKLYSKSFRQFKKKEILFVSPSTTIIPQTQPTIENINPYDSSLQSSFNIRTTSGVKSPVNNVYLSYLKNRSKSLQNVLSFNPFRRSTKQYPRPYAKFQFPKKNNLNLNTKCETLRVSKKEKNRKTTTKNPETDNKDINAFNKLAKGLSDDDYKKLTERLKNADPLINNNKNTKANKYKPHSFVIHNVYFQGVMNGINKEMDSGNQFNQQMTENYLCEFIKDNFKNFNQYLLKKKQLELAKEYYSNFNKQATKLEETAPNKLDFVTLSFSKKLTAQNNEGNNCSERQITIKQSIKRNQSDNCNMCQYSEDKLTLDENCFAIQPTKNKKMKNIMIHDIMKNKKYLETNERRQQANKVLNNDDSDDSLNQDLLNEYLCLNTQIQNKLLKTNRVKDNILQNQTHREFWKKSLGLQIEDNTHGKTQYKKFCMKDKKSESQDDKISHVQNHDLKAINDFLYTMHKNRPIANLIPPGYIISSSASKQIKKCPKRKKIQNKYASNDPILLKLQKLPDTYNFHISSYEKTTKKTSKEKLITDGKTSKSKYTLSKENIANIRLRSNNNKRKESNWYDIK